MISDVQKMHRAMALQLRLTRRRNIYNIKLWALTLKILYRGVAYVDREILLCVCVFSLHVGIHVR